jgi:putative membrane protein
MAPSGSASRSACAGCASRSALLPVAQIGGDLVRARLFAARGAPLPLAAASCIVDLTMEMAAQIVFTLAGAIALVAGAHDHDGAAVAVGAVAALAFAAGGFLVAQRLGLFRLIEPLVERGGHWTRLGDLSGLHEAILALYRRRAALVRSGAHHLAAWVLGAVETWAALAVLGLSPDLREALVIEALGQAVRGAGFLIPGALGIQEGGYLLICALFGIAAPDALALSLIRRIRELALGLPGLVAWHRAKRRPASALAGDAA